MNNSKLSNDFSSEELTERTQDVDSDSETSSDSGASVTSVASTPEFVSQHNSSESNRHSLIDIDERKKQFSRTNSLCSSNSIQLKLKKESSSPPTFLSSNNHLDASRRNSFLFRNSKSKSSSFKKDKSRAGIQLNFDTISSSKSSPPLISPTSSQSFTTSHSISSPDLKSIPSKEKQPKGVVSRLLSISASEGSPRSTTLPDKLKVKDPELDRNRSSVGGIPLRTTTSSSSLTDSISSESYDSKSKSERERERVQEWHQSLKMNEDSSGDIVLMESGEMLAVWAGTKEKLIERLTYEKYPDPRYAEAFLLTFRAFISPIELLEGIIKRYNIPQPEGTERSQWVREKQTPIRLRVFNCLKSWIEKHFRTDFQKDQVLTERLKEFLETDMKNDAPTQSMSNSLLNILKRQTEQYNQTISKGLAKPIDTSEVKAACVPMSIMSKTNLHLFSTKTLAEQMCLVEFDIYKKIEPKECLKQSWNKKDRHTLAPNICSMISYFNYIAAWVSTEIVSVPDTVKRAMTLAKFIDLAEELKRLGNFNGFTEVIAGLESSVVFRLKKTWEILTPESRTLYEKNKQLLDSTENFSLLRNALRNQELPSLPYLGMFLTDLTFVEDANTDLYLDTQLINFKKLSLVADIILQIQHYQQTSYEFEKDAEVMDYLQNLDVLNEKDLTEHSLLIEPRKARNKPLMNQ